MLSGLILRFWLSRQDKLFCILNYFVGRTVLFASFLFDFFQPDRYQKRIDSNKIDY